MGIFSASSSQGRNAAGAIIWLTVKSKVRKVATTGHIKPHPTISPHSSLTHSPAIILLSHLGLLSAPGPLNFPFLCLKCPQVSM